MSAPKPSKKYKKVLDQMSGTDVGVLVEEFTSQIKFVGEGLSGLNKKVDTLEIKVDRIDSRLDNVEVRLDRVEVRLDRVEVRLDRVEVKLDKIEGDVEIIKTDIELIKHDLKNKVSRDEFAILERRVALLENRTKAT